jgi:hypothetical protein
VGAAPPLSTPRSDNAGSVEDVIAGLADLDAKGLRLQWRNHLGGIPPAHLPRWLLLRVLTHQFQAAALGGPDKATLRVVANRKSEPPTLLCAARLKPVAHRHERGSTSVRERS